MSGRRRGKGGHGAEFHADERWLVSYSDMITVLMCLFIVLYAMSTVDSHKFDVLKNSLASGFGVTNSKKLDLSKGVPVPKNLVDKKGAGFTASDSTSPLEFTKQLEHRIQAALKAAGMRSKAEVSVSSRGVTVGLVGSSTYFGGNDASLSPTARTVLDAIGPVVAKEGSQITIEGHADPHGQPGPFPTDWDLASARATAVLRFLVEHEGVPGKRISSVSYGSSRPTSTATTQAAIEHNRRVDIVIHTPAPVVAAAAPAPTAAPAASAATAEKTTTSAEGATGHH